MLKRSRRKFLGLAAGVVWGLANRERRRHTLLLLWLTVVVVSGYLAFTSKGGIYTPHYVILILVPGLILAAKALLAANAHPTREEFLVGMEGNICRCTGYNKILRACELAADALSLPRRSGIPAQTSGSRDKNVAPTTPK